MSAFAAAYAIPTAPRAEPKKKVLLVDDSATTHMWIKMILSKTAYELISARDGEEGVRTALAERPDLILMDVVMPRMNGFEATRALRERNELRDTPIIMVTTRSEAKNVEEGYESGCSDYITKPIDGIELVAKVRDFIGE
ncbi:MAG TPA: response regulator [Longimicrobium sp.]|jgi:DNA-binding response OmpR family regulator|uniref:response regulator n=1 Tax=Longimicrobium sp. TaxID=2029185 RepID=UPI002ED92616